MESVSSVGVLDKAIGVLHAIEHDGPQTLVDLQTTTGLPRATLHRLAVALERHGLLRRDQAGRFCLGLGLVALGNVAGETFPIAAPGPAASRRAVPADRRERAALRPRGRAPRCAVSLPSPHGLRWMVGEGALLPLHLGSAGRVLIGRGRPPRLGRDGRGARARRGVGERTDRRAVAGVLAAVSVGGPVERLTRQPGKRFGADVVAAAADIAAAL